MAVFIEPCSFNHPSIYNPSQHSLLYYMLCSSGGRQTYALYNIAGGLDHFLVVHVHQMVYSNLLCSLVISFFSTSHCPASNFFRANCVKVHKKQRNVSIKPDLSNLTSAMFTETFLQFPRGFATALIASEWECIRLTLHKTPRPK